MVDSTLNVNLLDEAEGFGLPLWFLSDADFDKLMSVTKPRQEILDGIERDIERLEADLRRKPPYTIAHHLLLKGIEHGTRH